MLTLNWRTTCNTNLDATIYLLRCRAASQTLRLADFLIKKTMGFPKGAAGSDDVPVAWSPVSVTPPRPLDMALSPVSLRAIASAEVAFDRLVNDHEVIYSL